MIVIGLDPGTEHSALVAFNGVTVVSKEVLNNALVVDRLENDNIGTFFQRSEWGQAEMIHERTVLVIEQIESFGMAVGREVFETVFWTGRFAHAWSPRPFDRMPRRIVKQHLCHTARATDANIRQALIDRFGPSTEKAIGKRAAPGPLFGIKSHEWAALAVAVTWFDQNAHLPEF